MLGKYWLVFAQLIELPFQDLELIWGIVPLYFGWLLNELTSRKASFRTAVQTGFSFLWAGAHWAFQYVHPARRAGGRPGLPTVTLLVTALVLGVGLLALIGGLRRRFPKHGSFLGHTRFANYFMISIFPIQSNCLPWSWERLAAIAIFAVPVWIGIELLVLPAQLKSGKR